MTRLSCLQENYDAKNRLSMQMANNMPIEFSYTKYGQLENKTLGGKLKPVSSLTYLYTKSGQVAGRVVDGKHQMYDYDKKGQLLSVADMHGNIAESYSYDPAGNILSKTVDGKTTTNTYDKANQLVSSTCDGVTTNYKYDAAGRLVKEGDKTYTYGWLDKILSVKENGEQTAAFDYHMDGQIASATQNGKTESFLWDGLALIHRGETGYINEPYATGGNPLLSSKGEVMFNDMLGSTLGVNNETGFNPVKMSAFGETDNKEAFFTGKPAIGELGYAFLFRNYRADQGKWQTSDPLGYPDGWNNLAYCNNGVISMVDIGGLDSILRNLNQAVRKHSSNRYTTETQKKLQAARDAYILGNGGSSSLGDYTSTISSQVSGLNGAVQAMTGSQYDLAKSMMGKMDKIAFAGDNAAKMANNIMNNDPAFLANLIDIANGLLPVPPGMSDYLDFMSDALNAISDGLANIGTELANQYSSQLMDCDESTLDNLLNGFLAATGLEGAYNTRLNKLME